MSECDSIMFEICDLLCSKDDVFTAVHDFEYIASKIKEAALSKKFVLVELVNGDPQETRNEIEKKYKFHTTWRGTRCSCGTITVYVPKEKCTKCLLSEFKKYDKLLGAPFEGKCREYKTID